MAAPAVQPETQGLSRDCDAGKSPETLDPE